jgi:hypothetical protein
MSQLLRNVAVLSTGALLVMAVPEVADAKTVSNENYATTYCDAIEGALEELNDVETQAQSAGDPVAFRTGALATVDSVIASLQSAAANLQKLSPKDGGKKVATLFDATLTGQASTVQAARDAFAAVDPNSGAFADAVGTLLVAATSAADTFDEPLAKLGKHRALRRAVKKSCDIVRVTRS